MNLTAKQIRNFWKKVSKSDFGGCWLWCANRYQRGYGQFMVGRKCVCAHRVSWVLKFGEIPIGLSVLHKCDNPPCVNPSHLFLGTQKQNIQDMDKKGRRKAKRGESHWNSYLTDEDVKQIREMYSTGKFFQKEIARKFKTTQSNVSAIILVHRRKIPR